MKKTTQNKTPFGEPDHIPHSEMEKQFDEQSKKNYERIDKEVVDALKEADRICPKEDFDECRPLLPSERKAVRKTIAGMERFTVWLSRITFMLFLFAYWCVEHPKCLAAQEKVKALEERVEQLESIVNPTNMPVETIWFDPTNSNTMIARN